VARDGSAGVYEVYPAASIRAWGLEPIAYKGTENAGVRDRLLDSIERDLRSIEWSGRRPLLVANEDAFDAFVAALTARAAAARFTLAPADIEVARREGWIHVPLRELRGIRPTQA
jgi:hypothetical protein